MYTDEQLMALLQSQNQTDINKATDCLYQRYFTSILFLVRGNQYLRLDDKSFAIDIFFESVKGMIIKAQKEMVEPNENFNIGAYFRGIFKNKFLDAAEKEKKRRAKLTEEKDIGDKKDESTERGSELEKIENAFIKALIKTFNELKEIDKHILCLHLYAGLKESEIFEKGIFPDMTYGNIRQRYIRACGRLKENLAHFDLHQLSNTDQISMKNLCQQYQNHTDNG